MTFDGRRWFEELSDLAFDPAFGGLHPYDSMEARFFLSVIALVESGGCSWQKRRDGLPDLEHARGWWQFERAGVRAVLSHPAGWKALREMVPDLHARFAPPEPGVEPTDHAVDSLWRSLAGDPRAAAALARALLWTHPKPLPPISEEGLEEALHQWETLWRPGAMGDPQRRVGAERRFTKVWSLMCGAFGGKDD